MNLHRFPIVQQLAQDQELVFEFFTVFSRFEYALKRSGYLRGNEDGVEPDWDKFAGSLRGGFR